VRPDYARFVIRDVSKLAIFYSYKIRKQCKWMYSSNWHSSFNICVNSLAKWVFFLTKSKNANYHESRIVWPHHKRFIQIRQSISRLVRRSADMRSTHLTGAFSAGDSVRPWQTHLWVWSFHSNTKTSQREGLVRTTRSLSDFDNWFETIVYSWSAAWREYVTRVCASWQAYANSLLRKTGKLAKYARKFEFVGRR